MPLQQVDSAAPGMETVAGAVEKLAEIGLTLVQGLPMGILIWRLDEVDCDDSLRLLLVNDAASRLLGADLRPRAQAGAKVRDIFPTVSAADVRVYADVARTGRAPQPAADRPAGDGGIPPGAFSRRAVALGHRCVAVVFEHVTDEARAAREIGRASCRERV